MASAPARLDQLRFGLAAATGTRGVRGDSRLQVDEYARVSLRQPARPEVIATAAVYLARTRGRRRENFLTVGQDGARRREFVVNRCENCLPRTRSIRR